MTDSLLWAIERPHGTHRNRVKWPTSTATTQHNGHARATGHRCREVAAVPRDLVLEFMAVLATLFAVIAGVWI